MSAWVVSALKGDAVFLKGREQAAVDYAAKHKGIIIQMYGQAPVNSGSIRPAWSITVAGSEQLPPDASSAGEVCEASKPT